MTTTASLRTVDYAGHGPLQTAHFLYFSVSTPTATAADLTCSIPGGGVATKRGQVQLSASDWTVLVDAGTELPAAMQPSNLERRQPTPPPSYLAAAPTATPDPGGDACSAAASEVFHRLAAGQLTLDQARAQLPSKVPASALTSGLAGVARYQRDGLDRASAIEEASGAVAQACEY